MSGHYETQKKIGAANVELALAGDEIERLETERDRLRALLAEGVAALDEYSDGAFLSLRLFNWEQVARAEGRQP